MQQSPTMNATINFHSDLCNWVAVKRVRKSTHFPTNFDMIAIVIYTQCNHKHEGCLPWNHFPVSLLYFLAPRFSSCSHGLTTHFPCNKHHLQFISFAAKSCGTICETRPKKTEISAQMVRDLTNSRSLTYKTLTYLLHNPETWSENRSENSARGARAEVKTAQEEQEQNKKWPKKSRKDWLVLMQRDSFHVFCQKCQIVVRHNT